MPESSAPTAEPTTVDAFVKTPTALFELVASHRISHSAGWLYVVLSSHVSTRRPDSRVWPSRATLARLMGFSKPATVDRYLKELEDAGLIKKSARRIGGMKARNSYEVRKPRSARTPQPGVSEPPAETEKPQVDKMSVNGDYVVRSQGLRCPLPGTQDVPGSGQELEEVELDEDELDEEVVSEVEWSNAVGRANEDPRNLTIINPEPELDDRPAFADWRTADRELFRAVVGDEITTDGSVWGPAGTFPADVWYDALRNHKTRPVDWPGRYVSQLADDGGLDNWLLAKGLDTWQPAA